MVNNSSHEGSGWSLCFLSGPMSGRTLWLAPGENWVGTGADCEVILPDREIAARQMCVHVGAIAASVQNFGGAPVTLNGAPLGEMRRTLAAGDTVTVGSIRFGVEHAALATPLPAGAAGALAVRREGAGPSWLVAHTPAWLAALGARRLVLMLLALWSAFALAAGGYVAVATRGEFWWSHESRYERIREVEAALRGYPELTVSPGEGEGIVVAGYVRHADERTRVTQIAGGFPGVSLGTVYVVDQLLAATRQTLSDTSLSAQYDGRGRIVLTGVASRAIAQRVENFKRDAKPAVDVIDRVSYDDNAAGAFITSTGGAVPEDIAGLYGDDSGTRYIVTRDGRHFFEGATLPNGLTIASIGPDRVVFQRNGAQYVVKIGNGPEGPGASGASGIAPAANGVSRAAAATGNATDAAASGTTAAGNAAGMGNAAGTGTTTGASTTSGNASAAGASASGNAASGPQGAATGTPPAQRATQTPRASGAPDANNMVNAAGVALEARAHPAAAPPHS